MAAALSLTLELEVEETGEFAVADRPAGRQGPREPVRASVRAAAPGRRLHLQDQLADTRSSGGLGSSAAAIVAGLMAADHLFELDADLLELASALEGHPDNVAAALYGGFVICADGQATRFDAADGAGGAGGRPRAGGQHARRARGAGRRRLPREDAVFNIAHARAADARPRARRLGSARARSARSPARAPAGEPVPTLVRAGTPRARAGRARRDDLGRGPDGAGVVLLRADGRRRRGAGRGDRRLGERCCACRSRRRAPTWRRSESAARGACGVPSMSPRRASTSAASAR